MLPLARRLAALADPATRGWAILTAGNFLRLAVGFVASVLIARALGPATFATFAVLGALATIAGALVDPGLTNAAVQRIARAWPADPAAARARARAFFWWRAAAACALSALAWGALAAVGAATGWLPSAGLLALALLGTAATALSGALAAILQGLGRFGRLALVGLTNAALTALLALALAATGRLDLVAALAVLGVGTSLAAAAVGRALLPPGWRLTPPAWPALRAEGIALFAAGRWLWLAHGAALLAGQLDLLLVGHWRDPAETGTYALALNLAAKADIANSGLYTVLLPAASALAGADATRHYLRQGLLRSGAIALALLPTALLIGPFVDLAYGAAYHPAARLYQLLLAVVLFDLLATPLTLLAYGHERPRLLAGADLLRVAVVLALGTALIPAIGVPGAIVARLAAKIAALALILARLPRRPPP